MPYTTFDYMLADHVAHIKFNRPDKLNTMVPAFWTEMIEVFAAIAATPAVRAVVISSTGRHFTAGMDLAVFDGLGTAASSDRARVSEQLRRSVLETQESFNVIEACRVPVLAAVQGGCIGGGVDLISACDMRYCTADAFFCIQEINIGMVADVGTLQRLPHLMPAGLVRELAYSGRRLPAAEAKSSGLVNAVHADQASMLEAVLGIARDIAAKSPLAVHGTKEVLKYTRDHSVADGLDYIAVWNAGMLLSEDMAEQMRANQEKRPAKFADLLPSKRLTRRR
ncbi:MAG TPA: crotonase/enoyl-CoA hydratase family protein [Candidatus Sulfotelmatobacter sp.]|nr:crotonase/enoyl-CoA hydratase family protein [Candidatus Sulfotelmatobacter sp.]